MSKNSGNSSTGQGYADILLIVFIVLKLCGVIDWSWWWVLSPLWISLGIVILIQGWYSLWGDNDL